VIFFVLYVFGRQSRLFSFLFINLAISYDEANVLFSTGLIGSLPLCVFMYMFCFGAVFYGKVM